VKRVLLVASIAACGEPAATEPPLTGFATAVLVGTTAFAPEVPDGLAFSM